MLCCVVRPNDGLSLLARCPICWQSAEANVEPFRSLADRNSSRFPFEISFGEFMTLPVQD